MPQAVASGQVVSQYSAWFTEVHLNRGSTAGQQGRAKLTKAVKVLLRLCYAPIVDNNNYGETVTQCTCTLRKVQQYTEVKLQHKHTIIYSYE